MGLPAPAPTFFRRKYDPRNMFSRIEAMENLKNLAITRLMERIQPERWYGIRIYLYSRPAVGELVLKMMEIQVETVDLMAAPPLEPIPAPADLSTGDLVAELRARLWHWIWKPKPKK